MTAETDVIGSLGHLLIASTSDPDKVQVTMYGSGGSVISAQYDPAELLMAIHNSMNVKN